MILDVLYKNRFWTAAALALFLASGAAMFIMPPAVSGGIIGGSMEAMERLAEGIMSLPPLGAALFVFLNNFVVMLQMVVLGAVAGISPMITLGINGALVGTMAAMTARGDLTILFLVVGTLPHGIFELPAFLICGGMGLKLGYHCTLSPLPGYSRFGSFRLIWREIFVLLPLVAALLLVAAFVELFVTLPLAGRAAGINP